MLDKILGFIANTLKKSFIGTVSDVYWWQNAWTAPSDGILVLRIVPSASNWYFYVNDTTINATTGSWAHQFRGTTNAAVTKTIPVKKGSKYSTASMGSVNVINCFFYPIKLGGGYCIAVFSMLSAIGRWWEHVRQNTEFPRSKTRTIRCVIPAIKAFVIALFWDIRPSAQDCETVHLCKIESEHLAVRRSIHDSNEVSAQKQHWHAVHMYDIKRVHCCLLCCSKNKWTNSSGFRQHIARNSDYWRIHHLIPERGWEIC